MRIRNVRLEAVEVVTVPMLLRRQSPIHSLQLSAPYQVDIIAVAPTSTRIEEILQPVKAHTAVRAGRNGRERLLDSQRVDVLLVPVRGAGGADAVQVGLVQREDGW